MTHIDDYKGSLRIITFLIEEDIPITGFHNSRGSNYAVAGQGAVNRTLGGLMALGLVEQYVIHVGLTKAKQVNNKLTELGKSVAPVAKKLLELIPERLES